MGALVLLALGAVEGLLVFAAHACPGPLPGAPCPDAGRNQAIVVGLASLATTLLVIPFAFLAEFAARRRIAYRGAWRRATRRGVLVGVLLAVLGGLRIGGALSLPVLLFFAALAVAIEWLATRRFDRP